MKNKSILIAIIIFLLTGCVAENTHFENRENNVILWSGDSAHLEILKTALNASSSHNSQPWQIIVEGENQYRLVSVQDRWLIGVDPEQRELLLSLGALIENLYQASEAYGYDINMEMLIENRTDLHVATFNFVKRNGAVNNTMINILNSTYTEKLKYNKVPLDKEISQIFELIENNHLLSYYERGSEYFIWLRDSSVSANKQQAWNDELQEELADYICYSYDDQLNGIGLTPEMLRLPGFMARSWYSDSSRESVMAGSFRNGAASKVKSQFNNSSGIILIFSEGESVMELINSGRLYQKLLIETREKNLELHPISQILEEEPWKTTVQNFTNSEKPIQFILRVGTLGNPIPDYSLDSVTSASIRMPINDSIKILGEINE